MSWARNASMAAPLGQLCASAGVGKVSVPAVVEVGRGCVPNSSKRSIF